MPVSASEILAIQLDKAPLSQLAFICKRDWANPSPYAVPYIKALLCCPTIDSRYGMDSARNVALYFLSNASGWRGETARLVKAEIKRRLSIK